jgi:hypothetical protein
MLNLPRKIRLVGPKHLHAGAQPQRIQLVEGKAAMATLRAALPADQMLARPLGSVGKRRTHNLHQKRIA